MLSEGQKVGFFMAGAMKYAFSPKMSFGSPRIDFELILAAFWVPGEASNGKSLPGGGKKKRRFLRPRFFPILADFRSSEGAQTLVTLAPFSLLFQSWGLLFLLGGHFCQF